MSKTTAANDEEVDAWYAKAWQDKRETEKFQCTQEFLDEQKAERERLPIVIPNKEPKPGPVQIPMSETMAVVMINHDPSRGIPLTDLAHDRLIWLLFSFCAAHSVDVKSLMMLTLSTDQAYNAILNLSIIQDKGNFF